MSDFNSLPNEGSPAATDRVFTGRGAGAGAERKPLISDILGIFGILLQETELYLKNDQIYITNADDSSGIMSLNAGGASFIAPRCEPSRLEQDFDSSLMLARDKFVVYARSDAADFTFLDPNSVTQGRSFVFVNLSGDTITLISTSNGHFFNGSSGPVNSVAVAPSETVSFMANNYGSLRWGVISRYV